MPTAARLIAALSLAVLASVVSELIKPVMPDDTDFGNFTYINMAFALVIGWKVVGKSAGRGTTSAITNGLTGAGVLLLWGLFFQGAAEMFRKSMRRWYSDPFEAIGAVFSIAIDYFLIIMVPSVIGTLVIGGAIVGIVTEQASRRWR